MAAQTILELEEWLCVRLMTVCTGEGHRRFFGKCLPFHLHGRMAAQAGLPPWQNLRIGFRQEVMTGCAVEGDHPADIRAGGGMAFLAGLYLRLDSVQRGKVTGETFYVCSHHMDLMTRSFPDLSPTRRLAQMAIFAHLAGETCVRWNILVFLCRPMPHDLETVNDILLVARMAVYLLMGACLPGLPGPFHEVATATESRVIFDIGVEAIPSIRETYNKHYSNS
ncbi:MAG: hypothetical protein HY731_00100 [Candidatus Tectomicrobia bacterium]|nr:hypothetical protein [Candidatus Tectomicrobia bacterium]